MDATTTTTTIPRAFFGCWCLPTVISTTATTTTANDADDDVFWDDGSIFCGGDVHAIQQLRRAGRRTRGSLGQPSTKRAPHGKSDSRFFTNATESHGISDEVFDQRAERTLSVSVAAGRDATVSDNTGWHECSTSN